MEALLRRMLVVPDRLPTQGGILAVFCFPFSLACGQMSAGTLAVAEQAVQLCNTFSVDNVVCMGGLKKSFRTEGALMYHYISNRVGRPPKMFCEEDTRNTSQQGRYIDGLFPQLKGDSRAVVVVAHPFHLRRCEMVTCRALSGWVQVYRANAVEKWGPNDKRSLMTPVRFGLREVGALAATWLGFL